MASRKPLTVAPLLILVMSVFRGHTLTCPTEYQIGNQCCQMCPAGSRVEKDCTEFKQTSCLPCTEGTFMTHPTHFMRCLSCLRCYADFGLKLKTPCTATSDTVCEPLEGFYCLFFIEDGCMEAQKHSSCQPGQYISLKGTALSDTECSNCSDGTFSDGTLLTSCQPHTQCQSLNLQLIKPGTASTDAECGEQSSGAVIGIVVPVICSVVAGISLLILRKKGRCKNTERKRSADNPQQYFKKNKHRHEEEEELQGVAVINEHRDSSSDTAEERSELFTYSVKQKSA
ncbi:tumor necrosis factor receptor superfamily member 14-like [Sander lucioperca]|uniref:tumor necrosis factor receptor superfamily member 14-like n=1 Tax=Sander lucioperca TaxID=283035 RepID=UPI001653E27E|nr:tumor necrosis factor receptor superfamily member 14-like [Sander lucioperca]XP_035863802.1 tumor necrosis factor receptor superfamily member 14-like [Sander lucioperca]